MPEKLRALLQELQDLEEKIQRELRKSEKDISYSIEDHRVRFTREMAALHRTARKSLIGFLSESRILVILTSPVIYALLVPALIMDVFVCTYQSICFPIYGIPKVQRRDYIVLDRHRLAYLNGIEKLNCEYCAYFNGVIAFVREVASRTEQYWCPIRHALAAKGMHRRYSDFVAFGDAEGFRTRFESLRKNVQEEAGERSAPVPGEGGGPRTTPPRQIMN